MVGGDGSEGGVLGEDVDGEGFCPLFGGSGDEIGGHVGGANIWVVFGFEAFRGEGVDKAVGDEGFVGQAHISTPIGGVGQSGDGDGVDSGGGYVENFGGDTV